MATLNSHIYIDAITDLPRVLFPNDYSIRLSNIKIFPGLQHHRIIIRTNGNNEYKYCSISNITQDDSTGEYTSIKNNDSQSDTPNTELTNSEYIIDVNTVNLNNLISTSTTNNTGGFSESSTLKPKVVKAEVKKRAEYNI